MRADGLRQRSLPAPLFGKKVHKSHRVDFSAMLKVTQAPRAFPSLAIGYAIQLVPTIEAVRRANLRLLVDQFSGVAKLAAVLGKADSQVSQWLHATVDSKTKLPRNISSKSCLMRSGR